ncbi:MAG: bifunctional diaminohydroxyphosphoribosylaminopyrimidine deaminase/5-amino-6-(5-phosphoribosylamino)uracil reductase RibD, partial [Bacteroidota bacterium]
MPVDYNDDYWMRRCFALAAKGKGYTSPNPLVGAVIVKDGKKIGEGYHRKYGEHHAEINAINDALSHKFSPNGATLYVNLEPCFHYGKTPPCVDAIIQHQFSRVVVATIDPNPRVNGKSIAKLKKIGIQCTTGVLKEEAVLLNEKFFKFIKTKLPFVALKAAQTADGFIAKNNGSSKWITCKQSRRYVHRLRSEYDAVVVGANTVVADNPFLSVRHIRGRNPVRIVIDGNLRTSAESNVFNSDAPTILYTSTTSAKHHDEKISTLTKKNILVVPLPTVKGRIPIKKILSDLGKRNIASLLVEGGQTMFTEFLNAR